MPVNQELRPARATTRPGDDDRITCRGTKFCLQADFPAMFDQPLGASREILPMLRLGRNTGEAQVIAQLTDEPRFVLFQVIQDGLHGRVCSKGRRNAPSTKFKASLCSEFRVPGSESEPASSRQLLERGVIWSLVFGSWRFSCL